MTALKEALCGDEGVVVNDFCLGWVNTMACGPYMLCQSRCSHITTLKCPPMCSLRQCLRVLPGWPFSYSYISGPSETTKMILGPLDIRVAFRPQSTLRHQLVHPKDPTPMDQGTGVVYQTPCSEYPNVYVIQSGRSLKHSLSERRRTLQNDDVAVLALVEHVWSTGHHVADPVQGRSH